MPKYLTKAVDFKAGKTEVEMSDLSLLTVKPAEAVYEWFKELPGSIM